MIEAGPVADNMVENALPAQLGFAYYACPHCGKGKFDNYKVSDQMFCGCESFMSDDGITIPRLELAKFRPSTDLNAAFAAAERVGLLQCYGDDAENARYLIRECDSGAWRVIEDIDGEDIEILSSEPTPALAICAAILKLKEK